MPDDPPHTYHSTNSKVITAHTFLIKYAYSCYPNYTHSWILHIPLT